MRFMATDFAKRDLAIILSNQDATRDHAFLKAQGLHTLRATFSLLTIENNLPIHFVTLCDSSSAVQILFFHT